MKKILIGILAVALICSFAMPATAGNQEVLTITLDNFAEADILLDNTTWDPEAGLGENANTSGIGFKLTNNGSVQVDVEIKGEIGPDWSLGSSPGHNTTYLAYDIGAGNVEITTGDLAFVSDFAYDGEQIFGMWIDMPISSSTSDAQTITVTFTATAD